MPPPSMTPGGSSWLGERPGGTLHGFCLDLSVVSADQLAATVGCMVAAPEVASAVMVVVLSTVALMPVRGAHLLLSHRT